MIDIREGYELRKRELMKRTMYSLLPLLVLVLLPAPIYGTEQNAVVSRDAKIDNVQLHYLMAGHGPAVILLHGFAETSRMWRPLIPLLAEKFTVIAPDLPGIGDSSIPTDKIDMITSANRIHALVHSLGIEEARVVGHDIGLMVAYAYATQFRAETEKLVVMDAFLPGVAGWEPIYNAPNIWHFRFNGEYPEKLVQGRGAYLLRIFLERLGSGQKALHSRIGPKSLYRSLFEAGTDAGSMGQFCLVAAIGEGFRATVANEADGAGAVDRRREVVRKRTRRADETGRDRCTVVVLKDTGHWILEERPKETTDALVKFL